MKTRASRVLTQLRQGQIPTILKLNLSDPRAVELAGLSGTDAVWLCTEHVPNDWIGIESQIRAARLYDIDCFVRVARGSYSSYILPLEAGATGIIVPHVASAEEARQVVEWTRFHPMGKRALDGGNVDGLFCQLPMDEYIRHANTDLVVILQIESPEALEHVEEIAAVPGFDMLLFGAGDFSHRLGRAGVMDAPEIVNARKRIGAAARQHGKFAMLPGLMAPLPQLLDEGYRVFGCGSDVYGLGAYFKQRVDLMKEQFSGLPPTLQRPVQSPYV